MNALQLFDFENQQIRTLEIDGEPWFVGKDVAIVLGYADLNRAINQHVDNEDRKVLSYKASGDLVPSLWVNKNDYSNKILISESGVYSLIFNSKLPSAYKFKRWVTSEVLPAIRKHGAYMTDAKALDLISSKDGLISLLEQAVNQLKNKDVQITDLEDKNQALTLQLEETTKKASYLDVILGTTDRLATTQIAMDYGFSTIAFNRLLHEVGIQHQVNHQWILYKAFMGKNYTVTRVYTYKDAKGQTHAKPLTCWTQKGRKLIYDILKERDYLPLIERGDIR